MTNDDHPVIDGVSRLEPDDAAARIRESWPRGYRRRSCGILLDVRNGNDSRRHRRRDRRRSRWTGRGLNGRCDRSPAHPPFAALRTSVSMIATAGIGADESTHGSSRLRRTPTGAASDVRAPKGPRSRSGSGGRNADRQRWRRNRRSVHYTLIVACRDGHAEHGQPGAARDDEPTRAMVVNHLR